MLAKFRQRGFRNSIFLSISVVVVGSIVLGLFAPSVEASVDTSTAPTATNNPGQRKVVTSSNGTIVVFYNAGNMVGIKYNTSTDNGASWGTAQFAYAADVASTSDFSVAIDSSDNIYIVYAISGTASSRKFTYSGGSSWSGGTVGSVAGGAGASCSTGAGVFNISLAVSSEGTLVTTMQRANGGACSTETHRSTDSGSSWGSSYSLPANGTLSASAGHIPVAIGADMWVISQNSGNSSLVSKDIGTTGAWTSTGTSLSNSNSTMGFMSVTSASSDSLDVLWKNNSTNTIQYARYSISGNSFGASTTISSATSDVAGTITVGASNGRMMTFYQEFQASNSYKVAYKEYNGSSWSSAKYVSGDTSNNTNINSPAINGSSSNINVGVLWMTGTSSPYTINGSAVQFQYIPDAPTLSSPADGAHPVSTTPTLQFAGSDTNSDDLTYDTQIDTANTFDSQVGGGTSAPAIDDSYSESFSPTSFQLNSGGATQGIGQSFTGDGNALNSAKFYIKKFGSPTGNAVVKVYTHSGTFGTSSVPTGAALATSANFDVSTLTTSFQLISFSFSGGNKIALTNGTKYVVTIEYSGGDGSNALIVGADGTTLGHAGNKVGYNGSSWAAQSTFDVPFYVYTVSPALLNKYSNVDSGFSGSPDNTDPFTSGQTVSYAVQAGDALTRGTTYYWRVRAIDPSGSNTYGSWSATRSFTIDAPPATPTLVSPTSSQTGVSVLPQFQLRTSDADNDDLQYNIKVYSAQTECNADSGTNLVRSITEATSGWQQRTRQSNTAYVGSSNISNSVMAVYQYETPPLTSNTTYWWKGRALDPSPGSGLSGSWTTCQSFTTASLESRIKGGVNIRGGSRIK